MASKNDKQQSWFVKTKRFITVEPILIVVGIPFYLQSISIQNFALEKSCRVNLQFSAIVCDNMIDKALSGINCGNMPVSVEQLNETIDELKTNNATFYNVNAGMFYDSSLEREVCNAEIQSQKLISTISGYMAPLESLIGVVVILIGGYWSDISGRRKPLIMYPIVGDLLSQVVFLVGAIFMNELSVEFVAVLGSLIGAASGGVSLLFMAIFCYITEITQEKDRVFRFGLLYQLYPLIAICVLPFSGILYKKFGYIKLIFVSLLLEFIGILYTILVLKESKVFIEENSEMVDKTTVHQIDSKLEMKEMNIVEDSENLEQKNYNDSIKEKLCKAFRDVAFVIMRRRSDKGRMIVWLLLICNFVYVGCEYDQLLDELNMAEEYSNDRKRLRERNSVADQFSNSNYWDTEANSMINNRYRDHDRKQRFSTSTEASDQPFRNTISFNEIGHSPKRSSTTSNVLNQVHNETGNKPSTARSTFSGWTYRHPIIMQSIKSSMVNSNSAKHKNNLSKATISPNLNVSFLTESERLAKTDLFLLPSDDSGGGHLYTGMTDTSPSGDCSEMQSLNDVTSSESRVRRLMEPKNDNSSQPTNSKPKERSTERPNSS